MAYPNIPDLMTPNQLLQEVHDSVGNIVRHSVTFTAAGDGAVGAHNLFTVTGDVEARITAFCKTTLTIQVGATLEVGIAGATAAIIAQTAGDAIDVDEIWHDNAPDAKIELSSAAAWNIISGGNDIIFTVGTDTIDTGQIDFYCEWKPLSDGATVVPA